MKQGSLEEAKALSKEEAVKIMRQAGILGGRYLEPTEALVSEDDEVEYEQKIGEPPWPKGSR
jgi:hypothetical protein